MDARPSARRAWTRNTPLTRRRGELPEPEEELLGIHRETPEEEADAERARKDKEELRRAFLIAMMQNELFREWLMEQLVGFNVFGKPFAVSPTGFPDKAASQYQDGMRAAGWHLWQMFDDVAPELTSLMRREYNSR